MVLCNFVSLSILESYGVMETEFFSVLDYSFWTHIILTVWIWSFQDDLYLCSICLWANTSHILKLVWPYWTLVKWTADLYSWTLWHFCVSPHSGTCYFVMCWRIVTRLAVMDICLSLDSDNFRSYGVGHLSFWTLYSLLSCLVSVVS